MTLLNLLFPWQSMGKYMTDHGSISPLYGVKTWRAGRRKKNWNAEGRRKLPTGELIVRRRIALSCVLPRAESRLAYEGGIIARAAMGQRGAEPSKSAWLPRRPRLPLLLRLATISNHMAVCTSPNMQGIIPYARIFGAKIYAPCCRALDVVHDVTSSLSFHSSCCTA